MYRKYYQNDELTSNVLIAFVLFVMFGIIFYYTYFDTGGFTPSSIFYLGFSGLSFLAFWYHIIIYLISLRRPVLDYEIDFEKELIHMPFRRKIPFHKIKLYANRENRSEIKIFYRTKILNIILFQLQDDEGNNLTYELSKPIKKYSYKIGHRRLYNYNFIMIFIMISLNLIFILIQENFEVLHQTYKYFIVFGGTLLATILFIGVNVTILNRYHDRLNQKITGK